MHACTCATHTSATGPGRDEQRGSESVRWLLLIIMYIYAYILYIYIYIYIYYIHNIYIYIYILYIYALTVSQDNVHNRAFQWDDAKSVNLSLYIYLQLGM